MPLHLTSTLDRSDDGRSISPQFHEHDAVQRLTLAASSALRYLVIEAMALEVAGDRVERCRMIFGVFRIATVRVVLRLILQLVINEERSMYERTADTERPIVYTSA